MDSERWRKAKDLFEAALRCSPDDERRRFLEENCDGDEELRLAVESLLFASGDALTFLKPSPVVSGAVETNLTSDQKSLANQRFGHYKILRQIGAGGMGEVYLAEDARLRRKVALKILPETVAADAERLSRFEREARAASALNHPNILTVYEFGAENGVHFLATELVEGETLRKKLNDGEIDFPDALDIAEQIVFALSAAHAAGIVHRDIKPENIMIRRDGIIKVLDFGIAKLTAPAVDSVDAEGETLAKVPTQTKRGMILGTLQYMSPEQVRGQTIDARSDVFSLGVVIYEMLTGTEPFDKPTSSDVIAAILTENPLPLTQINSAAPAELERIVNKALKKNKDERYQTSKDFLLDIKSLRKSVEFQTSPQQIIADTGEMRRTNEQQRTIRSTDAAAPRRFSIVPALVLFLFISFAFGAVWWFSSSGNNRQAGTTQTFSPNTTEIVNWRSTPGEVYSAGSFSPDGKMVAFTSTKSGAKNIWVKQLSGGEAVQITKDEFSNQNPVWSPNGDEIAFYSTRGGTSGIWRTPAFGGTPVFVKAIEDGAMILRRWSKNDVIYYEAKGNLFALNLKSGETSQLTKLDSEKITAKSISISPYEEQIAYVTFENEKYIVWAMPVRGGSAKQLIDSAQEIRNTIWHSDGRRILYSQMTNGVFQIYAVETTGGIPTQITFGDKDAFALDASSDGAKILYGSSKEESDVWGVRVEKGEEFSFSSDINSELWANVAPDNKTIAFQSIKNLSQGDKIFSGAILTKSSDDSAAEPFQLVSDGFLPTWSPDGRQIAFMRVAGETYNLWTIKPSGGEEKQLTTEGLPSIEFTVLPYNRTQTNDFSWSPDSKKIAYISAVSQQKNVWLVDAETANRIQLTNNTDANASLYCPIWSADGKRIAYFSKQNTTSADGKKYFVTSIVDLETKNTKVVVQTENFHRLLGWSHTGKELFIAALNGKSASGKPMEVNLIEVDAESGTQNQPTKIEAVYLYNIYLSADKKMVAYVSNKDGKDDIWVLRLNDGGEPRKITSNNDARLYFSTLSWSPDNQFIYFGKQTRYSLLSMITNFK